MPNKKRNKIQYKRQVKTYLERHGRAGYQQAGSEGGKNSPTKFNSETASIASRKSWEVRRAKALESENENENNRKD